MLKGLDYICGPLRRVAPEVGRDVTRKNNSEVVPHMHHVFPNSSTAGQHRKEVEKQEVFFFRNTATDRMRATMAKSGKEILLERKGKPGKEAIKVSSVQCPIPPSNPCQFIMYLCGVSPKIIAPPPILYSLFPKTSPPDSRMPPYQSISYKDGQDRPARSPAIRLWSCRCGSKGKIKNRQGRQVGETRR